MSRRSVARTHRTSDLAMASQADSDFDECMATMKTLMSTVGVWPLDDVAAWSTCKFLALVLPLFFLNVLPQTAKAIESRDNFTLMLDVITTVDINEFIALVKSLTLWRRRLEMKTLVVQMREDWAKTRADEELRKMRTNARASKWILRFLVFAIFGTVISYDLDYLVNFEANVARINDTIYRPLYLKSYFPFETHESPVFEIVSVGQCVGANLSVFGAIAYDAIYVVSILHYGGQLHNLKRRMRNLVREHRISGVSFTRCIESAIQRQLHLVSHIDMLEESFNKTFLVQVIALSVALCLQGYQFIKLTSETELEPALLIFTVLFTLTNLNSIFFYCAIAQVIRDESLSLFDEIYQTPWYELPPKDALMIVMIMGRCKRPIELTVGKFSPLTLQYFARVMKTVVGYMSVLLAVKDKIME